jgi:integration host factor subunit alpha
MALTKNDIIEQIYELGFSKKDASELVETLLEIMKKSLETGEDILISGFGKFCLKEKEARRGRNPATGSDLMLRPRKIVTFKCSGKLRDKIN